MDHASSGARALADTGAGADRLLSCRQATLRRGQAAPLERDATHPLAQPHAARAVKRARVDEVITALRELCRGRTAGKIRTHLNYFLKNRRIVSPTPQWSGSGFRGAAAPSKAPSVASSISARQERRRDSSRSSPVNDWNWFFFHDGCERNREIGNAPPGSLPAGSFLDGGSARLQHGRHRTTRRHRRLGRVVPAHVLRVVQGIARTRGAQWR